MGSRPHASSPNGSEGAAPNSAAPRHTGTPPPPNRPIEEYPRQIPQSARGGRHQRRGEQARKRPMRRGAHAVTATSWGELRPGKLDGEGRPHSVGRLLGDVAPEHDTTPGDGDPVGFRARCGGPRSVRARARHDDRAPPDAAHRRRREPRIAPGPAAPRPPCKTPRRRPRSRARRTTARSARTSSARAQSEGRPIFASATRRHTPTTATCSAPRCSSHQNEMRRDSPPQAQRYTFIHTCLLTCLLRSAASYTTARAPPLWAHGNGRGVRCPTYLPYLRRRPRSSQLECRAASCGSTRCRLATSLGPEDLCTTSTERGRL